VTSESEAAGAPDSAGSAGPNGERLEGLTNTKPKRDLARKLLSTVAELLPVFAMERWEPHKPLAALKAERSSVAAQGRRIAEAAPIR
jgi:hypothetical protein